MAYGLKADVSDLSEGTLVEWDSSGGTAYGRVDAISTDGELSSSLRDEPMEGTEDNPAVRVELVRRNEDGEVEGRGETVLHRPGTLSVISEEDVPKSGGRPLTTKAGGTVKDVDTKGRTIVALMSRFGNIDEHGDVIRRGAFSESVQKEGPQGRDRIWHFADHDPTKRLGKPTRVEETSEGLLFETPVAESRLGDDILALYDQVGESMEHSVGMTIEDGEPLESEKGRKIIKAGLWEGSTVTWGANPRARLQEMKSDLALAEDDVIQEHIGRLKSLLRADLSGELLRHLELEVRMFEDAVQDIEDTKREKEKAEAQNGDRAEDVVRSLTEKLQRADTINNLTSKTESI